MTRTAWKIALRFASRLNVFIVVVTFLVGSASAQESPLAQLPANTSIVFQVRGVERTKNRLVAFLKNALPDLAPMVEAQMDEAIKNGFDGGRHLNGLYKDGPHFLILTDLPMPGSDQQPKMAGVLRLTNYQDFVKGLLKEEEFKGLKPTKDGYDVAMMGNEETYFIDRKDYVLVTPNKELAGQLAKKGPGFDGKLKPDIAKKLLDADVSTFVDMNIVNKEFGGQIQSFRQLFDLGFAQAGEQLGKANAEMIKGMFEGFFQFVEDSSGILLAAEFRPEGLAFHLQAQVGPDSRTNALFKSTQKSTFENLGQLPAGQLAFTGLSLAGPNYKLFQLMTQGAIEDEAKEIKTALADLEKSGPEVWIGSFQMPIQGIQITTYKDPVKASAAQLKLMQGLKQGENFMNIALKSKPDVKPEAQNYQGFKLHSASFVWDYEKTVEKQGGQQLPEETRKQMAEAMKKMMGEQANLWFGTNGKEYVQVTAKDWAAAQTLLNQFLEGKSAIKDQKAYQDTRKLLPPQTTFLALVDALPYFQAMGNYFLSVMKSVPLPIAIPVQSLPAVKGEPAYLGFAVTLESGTGGMDFWLPASAVKEVRKLVDAVLGK
ncbi:MAG TPA: hypothetical protein VGX70_15510 [Gemmataceae bacterium]|nr:hypothetical protein [Gemmataceae bacterium]